jgi:hypothetical protein
MDPLLDNPFHVLELAPGCTAIEIERQSARLLGMLELGLAAATTYRTPLGPRTRTAESVREAVAALRDPARRLRYEPWAAAPPGEPPGADPLAPWPEAFGALSWWP